MKHIFKFFLFCLFSIVVTGTYGKDYSLVSPDKSIELTVSVNSDIKWSVSQEGDLLLKKSPVSMEVNGIELGINPKIKKTNTTSVDKIIKPVVPNKDSEISDKYNEIELIFKGDYSLIFRAYDDGVAYRFNTSIKEESLINSEQFVINFNGNFTSFFPEEESTMSHNERYYIKENVSEISSERFCSLPVLFQNDKGKSILFTEADLYNYPNMFLHGTLSKSLTGKFPKHALEVKPNPAGKDRNQIITKEADYIAKTSGMRAFPWRVFIIADEDKQLVESNLVFQLSRPNKIENTDWIKPGKVAWDWWNANNVYGVDFEAGINNTTYKYYIDFASEYGLEYIILDEGWTKSTTNILACSPEINVQELVEYGKTKNVEVILWCLWGPLNDNLDAALDLYQSWGVKGIKVDFMQRSDQYMVNYYERVAEAASKRQLLVDYHGAFKPVGLSRTYPNVISYEGVKGMENCKWSDGITPGHDVTLPFIRMVAGPMDFTPGAMNNAQEVNFVIRHTRPMSLGTRCHQIAMYVVYESPLQMLCDNPSNYYKEAECTKFISQIPSVWDETIALDGKVGEYIAVARRKGNTWYVGAMTNWDEREMTLDLSFLTDGDHSIELIQDGINANNDARDYKLIKKTSVDKSLKIKLAKGGGWAAIIK